MESTTEQILADITSRDTHKVWSSACEIISLSQDPHKILPLIKHLEEIKEKTKALNMGGAFAPNQRFIDYAIRILEFHRDSSACTCNLYTGYDRSDPNKEAQAGHIEILNTTSEGNYFYNVICKKCGQKFKVEEGEYHYTWWDWKKN